MEKIATIDVSIDRVHEGPSRSRFNPDTKRGEIVLNLKNDTVPIRSKEELADVLAHELGHVVARMFEFPVHMKSLQDTFFQNFLGGPVTPMQYQAEVEAWDLAEKMRKINPESRDPRLESYRKGMK